LFIGLFREMGMVMELKLVVVGGKNAGQKIPVAGPKFFIGRSEECQLRPNSDLVSRHHCAILLEEDFAAIRDFGSKNGTFVNDERVRGEQELNSGDRLRVGPLEFEVELTEAAAAEEKEREKEKPEKPEPQEAPEETAPADATPADAAPADATPADATPADATPADGEVDISDWIVGEDETTETRTMDGVPASTIVMNTDELNQDDESTKEEPKEEKGKKKPTKDSSQSGAFQRPKAKDSQSAAEDTLRQFFHRK
jgi:pSer/pThr/pTyr-binding forkhead associated (FHA) protein